MTDVRALLRQQRSGRRIDHPHAAYTETGNLLCTACHTAVKAESLWDDHIRSGKHRQQLRNLQNVIPKTATAKPHKRKHVEEGGGNMDVDGSDEDDLRKKRSKSENPVSGADADALKAHGGDIQGHSITIQTTTAPQHSQRTPALSRRASSGTPVLGVEINIPSRPATPNPSASGSRSGSGSGISDFPSSAVLTPVGRSPLIPKEPTPAPAPVNVVENLAAGTTGRGADPKKTGPAGAAAGQGDVDEAEWAAFEAEVINAPPRTNGVVVSAAPVSAADAAAQDQESKKLASDSQLEDEKEDATRALETEFEEMKELESRVRILRERREALRQQSQTTGAAGKDTQHTKPEALTTMEESTKENETSTGPGVEGEEDEDEDEEDDDWEAFRFKV